MTKRSHSDNKTDLASEQPLLKGRLSGSVDAFVAEFTASVNFDYRLAEYDITGSIAHVRMLCEVGIVDAAERDAILAGLTQIQREITAGDFDWLVSLEDVHMNIEHRLIKIVGEVGKKLHTGRSRNDQVATSMRLYLRAQIDHLSDGLYDLADILLTSGKTHAGVIMPGFTHLQTAQPVTFGHHMLAWAAMLERDLERLLDCRGRVNRLPLGAAALAGTSFPVDRQFVMRELGFDALCPNSLDAVSDRDFAIEFCAFASLLMMHLSRWAEELILWSSSQFKFISLPDRFCTGSSIMPQKKNPDVPELVRGKSGRVFGHLVSLLTLMKAQPLAYNKDNQEDKESLFDTVDTVQNCIQAFAGMLPHIEPDADRMMSAAGQDFSTATDLVEYLVRQGVPFRRAHEAIGRAVSFAVLQDKTLSQLSLAELQSFNSLIKEDAVAALTPEGSVASRKHEGGTAPAAVLAAVEAARTRFATLHQRRS